MCLGSGLHSQLWARAFLEEAFSTADSRPLRPFQAKTLIKVPLTQVTDNQESSYLKMNSPGGESGGPALGLWRLTCSAGQLCLWAFLPKSGPENKGILQLLLVL